MMLRRTLRVLPLLLAPVVVGACDHKSADEAPASATVSEAGESPDDVDVPPAAEKEADKQKSRGLADSSLDAEPAPAASAGPGDGYEYDSATPGRMGGNGAPAAPQAARPSPGMLPGARDGLRAKSGWALRNDEKPTQGQDGLLDEGGGMPRNMFFQHYGVNPTIDTAEEGRSTFAVDVDTAAYTMTRSYLERGNLPNEAAVRVEELVNAFDYGYSPPSDGRVFNVHAEAAPSPNRAGYHVLHVGIKGKAVPQTERKNANLIFVVDVSGSMDQDNRLGLVKKSLKLLVGQLGEADKVGIVTYGNEAKEVLQPTSAFNKDKILSVVDALHTEGATNAEAGLRMGYAMASRSFRGEAVNRVILCSDGVANVGVTGPSGILATVQQQVAKGITMTTIGVGMGNYNDVLLEQLADKGNGNYYYVDKLDEARRVFVDQLSGTLQTIAKDVKIQIDFDKSAVARYRLIGYENRQLQAREFDNDSVDAGEVGAGHAVTAIYELKLKPGANALGTIRIRYKEPTGNVSKLIEQPIVRSIVRSSSDALSSPTQLSLVAAQFGEKLRGSYWARNLSYEDILARFNRIQAPLRQRADVVELRQLVTKAESLDKRGDKFESTAGPIAQMGFDRVPVLR